MTKMMMRKTLKTVMTKKRGKNPVQPTVKRMTRMRKRNRNSIQPFLR